MTALDELKRQRAALKTKLNNFISNDINAQSFAEIQIRQNQFVKLELLNQFEDLQEKIDKLNGTPGSDYGEFEDAYYAALAHAQELLEKRDSPNTQGVRATPSILEQNVVPNMDNIIQLPRINLPEFNGKYDEWLDFHNQFRSVVHVNPRLSGIQKFHYLRSCLKGEASQIISALEVSNENYDEAWAALETRYSNKRIIVQRHVKTFMELPAVGKESASELRKLIDTARSHLRALKSLGKSVEYWDSLLIYIITSKLDRNSHREWEKSLTGKEMPRFEVLIEFLENRCQILQVTAMTINSNPSSASDNQREGTQASNKRHTFAATDSSGSCLVCTKEHLLHQCEEFLKMSVKERVGKIIENRLCFNCLRPGHRNDQCTSLPCKKCPKKHHTLLHYEDKRGTFNAIEKPEGELGTSLEETESKSFSSFISTQVLLSTALVNIKSKNAKMMQARVLLDSGSQSHFITAKFAKALHLPLNKVNIPVESLSQTETRIKYSAHAELLSRCENYSHKVEFLVIERICDRLPNTFIDHRELLIPPNLKLADPEFHKPNAVDALLGAELFYDLLCVGQIKILGHSARLQKTKLGWIIAGKIGNGRTSLEPERCMLSVESIQKYITKFWDTEEIVEKKFLSEEELRAEQFFEENTRRDPVTGRIVINASAKTSTGISLNQCLYVGPVVQSSSLNVTLRFRLHQIVMLADIEKMYKQVQLEKSDAYYQLVFWREDESHDLKIFMMPIVMFGTASASHASTSVLNKLALDEKDRFPLASKILRRDCYVDDVITGTDDVSTATRLRDELIGLTRAGGFNLRKWISNDPSVVNTLSKDLASVELLKDSEAQTKALGIYWNRVDDQLSYCVVAREFEGKVTKRNVLSNIARLYDPMGLLGPVIVSAKILMQELWKCSVGWDESLPLDVHTAWIMLKNQLALLNNVKFNRKTLIKDANRIELHGFCDASEKAYGACVYLRSINPDGEVYVNLLCSKNRVAPVKTISIPKLELCSALVLSRLVRTVLNAICKQVDEIFLWSDSSITLQWINTHPSSLKTFVANRVAEISESTNTMSWRHVPSQQNMADALSRGQTPAEFVENEQWKSGPDWLYEDAAEWPKNIIAKTPLIELKAIRVLNVKEKIPHFFENYSNLSKLERIVAYVLRFKNQALKRLNRTKIASKCPSILELRDAKAQIIKVIQMQNFSEEINQLLKNKNIAPKSDLRALDPFIEDGFLRVGGRLRNSNLPYAQKHPILLPKNNHITNLIIEQQQVLNYHSGALSTLNAVRMKYWPINGKNTTKTIIRGCIKCAKAHPLEHPHFMGDLPRDRVIPTRPILHAGLDYCGPFFMKEKKFRNRGKVKVYACIFVCFATKAIHIELVTDLTTEAFLGGLRRFFARRGLSAKLYSDNATNFVGAKNELLELKKSSESDAQPNELKTYLRDRSIEWHFSPPNSPHFGGLWEAAVKSFKGHFYKSVGDQLFTYEELLTYSTEIESILNSRPITPMSEDPNDLRALSPAHFLIGDDFANLPEIDYSDIATNRLSSWQSLQKVKQHFWTRWSKEYLHQLNPRTKWQQRKTAEIKIDDLVLIKDDNTPPRQWKLGRIVKVFPGDDGYVRVVDVKTVSGTYRRSVTRISLLPID